MLAGIFLWAGIAKALRREDFFNSIGHYRLLSTDTAYRFSFYVPWVEIALACLLLVPNRWVARFAALCLVVMLLFFTAGLIVLWVRGEHVNCGCFGGMGKSHPAWSVLRNVGLILMAGLIMKSGRWRTDVGRI